MIKGQKMSEYDLQTALHEANKERALIYLAIYREIRKRRGEDEVIDVIRNALIERGRVFGETLKQFAPSDFKGLCEGFAYVPDGGKMFEPEVIRCDGSGLELKMRKCPLKEAWQSAGVSGDELKKLLNCASAMDVGTMEAAGFSLNIKTWQPGEEGCCYLEISKQSET